MSKSVLFQTVTSPSNCLSSYTRILVRWGLTPLQEAVGEFYSARWLGKAPCRTYHPQPRVRFFWATWVFTYSPSFSVCVESLCCIPITWELNLWVSLSAHNLEFGSSEWRECLHVRPRSQFVSRSLLYPYHMRVEFMALTFRPQPRVWFFWVTWVFTCSPSFSVCVEVSVVSLSHESWIYGSHFPARYILFTLQIFFFRWFFDVTCTSLLCTQRHCDRFLFIIPHTCRTEWQPGLSTSNSDTIL